MKDYDYVVLIDENGQPYIEHSIKDRFKAAGAKVSSGVKSAGRKAHKYILKVGEGAKAKYAYTKEEADALLGRGRKAVEKVSDKLGVTARKKMETARTEFRKADDEYESANRDRVKAWNDRASAMKTRDTSAHGQQAYDRAVAAIRKDNEDEVFEKTFKGRIKAGDKFDDARREYAKTPLAAVEKFLKDPVFQTEMALWSAGYDAREALSKVPDKVKGAREALSKVPENIRDSLGGREEKRRDKTREDMIRSSRDAGRAQTRAAADQVNADSAKRDTEDARLRYKAAESAVAAAQDAVIKAQGDAKAKTNTRDAYKEQYDNMGDEFVEKIGLALSSNARDRRDKVYQQFVKAGIDAADAAVAAEQAMRTYDSAIAERSSAAAGIHDAEVAEKSASDKARHSSREAESERDWAAFYKTQHDAAAEAYADTPLAKIDSLVGRGKEAFKSVKDRASETIKGISEGNGRDKSTTVKEEVIPEQIIPEQIIKEERIQGSKPQYPNTHHINADGSNVSNEYLFALGSNSGLTGYVNKAMDAEKAYNAAVRRYKSISGSSSADRQERAEAKREMDKLEKEYGKLRGELIDKLRQE